MQQNKKVFLELHLILLLYSICSICTKIAGQVPFLSLQFCFFYGIEICLLGVYAFGWQQVIKRLPLSVAYANKAVTIIWGSLWGAMFFNEDITIGKILGMCIVMIGVILYAHADTKKEM